VLENPFLGSRRYLLAGGIGLKQSVVATHPSKRGQLIIIGLVVANLAELPRKAIGANATALPRPCAYFHDVGKLVKPESLRRT